MKVNINVLLVLLTSSCVLTLGCTSPKKNQSANTDKILFSFATVGCNRVDKDDNSDDNPSTANIYHLQKTFDDILHQTPLPKYFFFTGDMVLGYTKDDTALLRKELQSWVDLYLHSDLPEKGVKMVPLLGNHESLYSKKNPASPAAEKVWLSVMKPFIQNNNGPIAGVDGLISDQSSLSYSFNYENTHFLILNSDGCGRESSLPVQWVSRDLSISNKNKQIEHVFAFAHKPAYPAPNEDGLDAHKSARDSFWTALENSNCEAMFAAHNHLFYKTQPNPKKTWQIVAGNGGSKLEESWKPEGGQFFGFTLVEVYASGKVVIKSLGRNLSANGYTKPTDAPTVVKDLITIIKER